MTTVSKILENLEKEDGLEVPRLEKSLKLSRKIDRDNLEIAIKALTKLGIVKSIENEKLVINKEIDFVRGRVRCSSKGYCFVVREDEGEDIYIRETNLNNAWHGDSVIVLITKEALKRRAPEGSIQCVLQRYNETLLAKIEKDNANGNLKAYPLDDRIPAIIDVEDGEEIITNLSNKDFIYEIEISKYPIAQFKAIGKIIREFPLNAGVEGDVDILLSKNNISRNIDPPKVSPKKIQLKGREDLTCQPSLLFSSWECKNSPSLPALFAQPYEGGNRIWIHSPSVSERLNIGGKLDKYLMDKGEAICLGNNWLEFLNETLVSASAFKLNEEREAISLMIDIDSKGIVIDWKFSLSIIKPVKEVTDKHLQTINNRKATSKSIPIALKSLKENLEVIYTIIHSSKLINQINNSSIKLDQHIPNLERLSELQKAFPSRDFHGWTKSYDSCDPQSILDIYIRLSNNILAKHLYEYKLPFIFKEHEGIEQSSINELTKSALVLDSDITVKLDGSQSANDLIKSFDSSSEKKILHKLVKHIIPGIHLKLFNHADSINYDELNKKSFISNVESPWCCPSLNYWNIFNQFIISLLLNDGKSKNSSRSKDSVNLGQKDSWKDVSWKIFSSKINEIIEKQANLKLIQHLNDRRKQSKSFRNNIISIAQGREAQKIIGKEVPAIITGVQSYGFFAEINELTSEGLVHVSTLGDDWYEYRSRQNLLIGRKNKKTYQLAQKINVRVLKVDILKNQIDLELIKNEDSDLINNKKMTSENRSDDKE
ncbi:RNB domain-containing ribonuclease [Prochlorococcus marinus]|uniref:RNA-binding protein n=1 Tax=Prochlorococcus marinus XMU1408 TaxID=2213228 RepID=A0A318R2S5_PROMR|nr:RNB domain-containing ribonuclease [Prochlorococcus marinus]MBW3041992.1 RNA-binding protein [Prochlorococcus marinus str. XMU1408]PYE03115.1 RNA-binding protein [Prochlorococcus marinus XMU1408]